MATTGPQVVEFNVEAVRKRPGLYIGDTARYGLYHLGYFVLDMMLSASQSPPTRVEVRIEPGGSLQICADCEPNDLDSLIALLDAGSYRGPPEALAINRWWELLTVSALSEELSLRWAGARGGGSWTGQRGKRVESSRHDASKESLSEVRFKVDGDLFSTHEFSFDHVAGRMRELAALYPGLRTRTIDSSQAREAVVSFPKGLVNLVSELSGINTEFAEPVAVEHTWGKVQIRGALQWTYGTEVESLVVSYANEVRTRGGGKHVTGLLRAVDEAGRSGLWKAREGLVAAIAVHAPRTELVFKGPTKDVLAMGGLDEAARFRVLPD